MNKKLLLVCNYASSYSGNFISSIIRLIECAEKKGIHVFLCFPEKAKSCNWINTIQCEKAFMDFSSSKRTMLKKLSAFMKSKEISVVHLHFVAPVFGGFLKLLNPKAKVIVHIHSDFSALQKVNMKTRFMDFLTFQIFRRGVVYLSVSSALASKRKLQFVPNALDADRVKKDPAGRAEIRSLLGVQDEEILCMVFGWSPYVKGVDIAVEAVRSLHEAGKHNVKLAIVHGAKVDQDNMKIFIKEHTQCTGEEAYILYLPPTEDVFAYYNAADVFVSSSRSEAFSYSILEALSIGKSVCSSDLPSVMWSAQFPLVQMFRSGDPADLAERILDSVKNAHRDDRDAVAKNVVEKYDINCWCDTMISHYLST